MLYRERLKIDVVNDYMEVEADKRTAEIFIFGQDNETQYTVLLTAYEAKKLRKMLKKAIKTIIEDGK